MEQPVKKLIEQQTDEELSLTEEWAKTLPLVPREDYLTRIATERYKRCHRDPNCLSIQVSYVDDNGVRVFKEEHEPKANAKAREELNKKIEAILDGTTTLFHKERIAILQVAIEKYGVTDELFKAYTKEMLVEERK